MNSETPAPNEVQPNQQGVSTGTDQPPMDSEGQSGSTPTPGSNSKTKRIILILLGVALLLLIGFGIIRALSERNNATQTTGLNTDIYHSRPGYDIKEYGSDIGDPLALTMDTFAPVRKSPKGPIIYACNVLTVKDLNGLKNYVMARQDAKGVTRTYIDGVGEASITPELSSLPTGDEGNECDYSLQSGGLVSITVYQEPFTSKATITDQLDRNYTQTDNVNGLATYKEKDRTSASNYIIMNGNNAIEILFNGTKINNDAQQSILTRAAKNFIAQQSNAQGPALAAYNTPTYKKRYARACDLISNNDIKMLTDHDASAYVKEGLATGTGVLKVDDTLYNFITTSCNRFNTGIGDGISAGPFDQELEMTVSSYNDTVPAKQVMQKTGENLKNKTPISVGDEGFGFQDSADQNTVLFRQGRFIVELVFDRTLQAKAGLGDVETMNSKLMPFALQTAAKLKGMQ